MSIKSRGKAMISISDLQRNLFVRQELDGDYALYLADLLEAGVKLPAIRVSEDKRVVDGRHRIEAHELTKQTEIEAEIYHYDTEAELIADAYRANAGGPKPPTIQDTEHTIMLLLEGKETMKRIAELLGLPVSITRKYANEVKSRMTRAKLQRAAQAVTDGGLTVQQAAEAHEVDREKLKETLSGRRKKSKNGVQDIHRTLTFNYKSVSSKNAAIMRSLTEKYTDGDVSAKQVRAIIEHIENLQKKHGRAMADWKRRFDALSNPPKSK